MSDFSRRQVLAIAGAGLAGAMLPQISLAAGATPTAATAITEVFGDGLRLIGVALEYADEQVGTQLAMTDYTVEGRRVTDVATAASTDPASAAPAGRFVLVMLDPEDAAAQLYIAGGRSITRLDPKATVAAGGSSIATSGVRNLVVDEFQPRSFTDPATGGALKYNLFVPRDYDPSARYPLVLFMHDLSVTSDIQDQTLVQGLGAVVWARPEEQARNPCFVLAPQFDVQVVDDQSNVDPQGLLVVPLLAALQQEFSIDAGRLYTTGQSGGGMLCIALDIAHPDLFAASLLVACQWDTAKVDPMAGQHLFIIVSQEDDKAFPGQNAITDRLETLGASVHRAVWNGGWSDVEFDAACAVLRAQGAQMNYAALAAGTVLPAGASTECASAHRATWPIAYTIRGVRDWLFAQSKAG